MGACKCGRVVIWATGCSCSLIHTLLLLLPPLEFIIVVGLESEGLKDLRRTIEVHDEKWEAFLEERNNLSRRLGYFYIGRRNGEWNLGDFCLSYSSTKYMYDSVLKRHIASELREFHVVIPDLGFQWNTFSLSPHGTPHGVKNWKLLFSDFELEWRKGKTHFGTSFQKLNAI